MSKQIERVSRRAVMQGGAAVAAAALLPEARAAKTRAGRVRQSVARWCYKQIPLEKLCAEAAAMGLKGVDLLQPEEYGVPARFGLVCAMAYAGGGEINKGLNRIENHASIEAGFRKNIPLAAKAGVPNVITFSGQRAGLSDEEGARNCVTGLRRLRSIAEDNGVTICLELLNSKVNHPDYMCDRTAWGVRVVEEVDSPRVKLLYDIYHMQIMEGDLIATIRANSRWIGHFHTGGVPGRHELDGRQEVQWDGVMRGIVDTGYTGFVAHEFVPTGDPMTSLRQAVEICDV
jgi:hydroxypyruvate isomerase